MYLSRLLGCYKFYSKRRKYKYWKSVAKGSKKNPSLLIRLEMLFFRYCPLCFGESEISESIHKHIGPFKRFNIRMITNGTIENFLWKSALGFLSGIIFTYILFVIFVAQLKISLDMATSICSILGFIFSLGLAFSKTIRCCVLMTIPHLFSKRGRQALTAYAIILSLTGPAKNTLSNTKVLSESLACGQELVKTNMKAILELTKKPFRTIKEAIKNIAERIKNIVGRIKEYIDMIKRTVSSLLGVIHSSYEWLNNVVSICNKKVGTPFERCMSSFDGAIIDCKLRLGPTLDWICSIAYVTSSLCYAVKFLDYICEMFEYSSLDVVQKVKKKMTEFSLHVRNMFYVSVDFSHSFSLDAEQSKSFKEIASGIITEIRHRTNKFLALFNWLSFVFAFFFFLILFKVLYYRYKFLKSDKFDNKYITKFVEELDYRRALDHKETILPLAREEKSKYNRASSFKLLLRERISLIMTAVILGIVTLKISLHMAVDYSLWWLLDLIRRHGRIQTIANDQGLIGVKVDRDSAISNMFGSIVKMFEPSNIRMDSDTLTCLPDPFPPDIPRYRQILFLLGLTWLLAITEPYGLRLRSVVMSYYHPDVARRRAIWLYNRILARRGSLVKYLRRQLRRKYTKGREGIEPITFRERVFSIFPLMNGLMGTSTKNRCLMCCRAGGISSPLLECSAHRCLGVYCTDCFKQIGNVCTICKDPLDYGDLSDVSIEKDSSDEENSLQGIQVNTNRSGDKKKINLKEIKGNQHELRKTLQKKGIGLSYDYQSKERAACDVPDLSKFLKNDSQAKIIDYVSHESFYSTDEDNDEEDILIKSPANKSISKLNMGISGKENESKSYMNPSYRNIFNFTESDNTHRDNIPGNFSLESPQIEWSLRKASYTSPTVDTFKLITKKSLGWLLKSFGHYKRRDGRSEPISKRSKFTNIEQDDKRTHLIIDINKMKTINDKWNEINNVGKSDDLINFKENENTFKSKLSLIINSSDKDETKSDILQKQINKGTRESKPWSYISSENTTPIFKFESLNRTQNETDYKFQQPLPSKISKEDDNQQKNPLLYKVKVENKQRQNKSINFTELSNNYRKNKEDEKKTVRFKKEENNSGRNEKPIYHKKNLSRKETSEDDANLDLLTGVNELTKKDEINNASSSNDSQNIAERNQCKSGEESQLPKVSSLLKQFGSSKLINQPNKESQSLIIKGDVEKPLKINKDLDEITRKYDKSMPASIGKDTVTERKRKFQDEVKESLKPEFPSTRTCLDKRITKPLLNKKEQPNRPISELHSNKSGEIHKSKTIVTLSQRQKSETQRMSKTSRKGSQEQKIGAQSSLKTSNSGSQEQNTEGKSLFKTNKAGSHEQKIVAQSSFKTKQPQKMEAKLSKICYAPCQEQNLGTLITIIPSKAGSQEHKVETHLSSRTFKGGTQQQTQIASKSNETGCQELEIVNQRTFKTNKENPLRQKKLESQHLSKTESSKSSKGSFGKYSTLTDRLSLKKNESTLENDERIKLLSKEINREKETNHLSASSENDETCENVMTKSTLKDKDKKSRIDEIEPDDIAKSAESEEETKAVYFVTTGTYPLRMKSSSSSKSSSLDTIIFDENDQSQVENNLFDEDKGMDKRLTCMTCKGPINESDYSDDSSKRDSPDDSSYALKMNSINQQDADVEDNEHTLCSCQFNDESLDSNNISFADKLLPKRKGPFVNQSVGKKSNVQTEFKDLKITGTKSEDSFKQVKFLENNIISFPEKPRSMSEIQISNKSTIRLNKSSETFTNTYDDWTLSKRQIDDDNSKTYEEMDNQIKKNAIKRIINELIEQKNKAKQIIALDKYHSSILKNQINKGSGDAKPWSYIKNEKDTKTIEQHITSNENLTDYINNEANCECKQSDIPVKSLEEEVKINLIESHICENDEDNIGINEFTNDNCEKYDENINYFEKDGGIIEGVYCKNQEVDGHKRKVNFETCSSCKGPIEDDDLSDITCEMDQSDEDEDLDILSENISKNDDEHHYQNTMKISSDYLLNSNLLTMIKGKELEIGRNQKQTRSALELIQPDQFLSADEEESSLDSDVSKSKITLDKNVMKLKRKSNKNFGKSKSSSVIRQMKNFKKEKIFSKSTPDLKVIIDIDDELQDVDLLMDLNPVKNISKENDLMEKSRIDKNYSRKVYDVEEEETTVKDHLLQEQICKRSVIKKPSYVKLDQTNQSNKFDDNSPDAWSSEENSKPSLLNGESSKEKRTNNYENTSFKNYTDQQENSLLLKQDKSIHSSQNIISKENYVGISEPIIGRKSSKSVGFGPVYIQSSNEEKIESVKIIKQPSNILNRSILKSSQDKMYITNNNTGLQTTSKLNLDRCMTIKCDKIENNRSKNELSSEKEISYHEGTIKSKCELPSVKNEILKDQRNTSETLSPDNIILNKQHKNYVSFPQNEYNKWGLINRAKIGNIPKPISTRKEIIDHFEMFQVRSLILQKQLTKKSGQNKPWSYLGTEKNIPSVPSLKLKSDDKSSKTPKIQMINLAKSENRKIDTPKNISYQNSFKYDDGNKEIKNEISHRDEDKNESIELTKLNKPNMSLKKINAIQNWLKSGTTHEVNQTSHQGLADDGNSELPFNCHKKVIDKNSPKLAGCHTSEKVLKRVDCTSENTTYLTDEESSEYDETTNLLKKHVNRSKLRNPSFQSLKSYEIAEDSRCSQTKSYLTSNKSTLRTDIKSFFKNTTDWLLKNIWKKSTRNDQNESESDTSLIFECEHDEGSNESRIKTEHESNKLSSNKYLETASSSKCERHGLLSERSNMKTSTKIHKSITIVDDIPTRKHPSNDHDAFCQSNKNTMILEEIKIEQIEENKHRNLSFNKYVAVKTWLKHGTIIPDSTKDNSGELVSITETEISG